ncbi:MAG: hypothetical protein PHG82_05505 [Candidatus Gracilibacteria bacterium]|nr:hypothetical protein [Candidatus Gracilibacteria bacterium]
MKRTEEIYIRKFLETCTINPIESREYQEILGLLPTLQTAIKESISILTNRDFKVINKTALSDNYNISDHLQLEIAKLELKKELYELSKITGKDEHIYLYIDDCFTNKLLIKVLEKILGEKEFERFVSIVNIDLSKEHDEEIFKTDEISNNSLILFGGSLNDTYTIDKSHYESRFAEMIKLIGNDYSPHYINQRIIGICFGQQFIANLMGITNSESSGIIATYKGPAQFGPSNCTVNNSIKYDNHVFYNIMSGLNNNGLNSNFSTFFTRTGYVDSDLLKTSYHNSILPLVKDNATDTIVGWGSRNSNILGIQFHPEISFFDDKKFLEANISEVLPYLKQYKNPDKLYENFNFDSNFDGIIAKDIGESFYTFALLAYIKDIKNKILKVRRNLKNISASKNINENISFDEAFYRVKQSVLNKINIMVSDKTKVDIFNKFYRKEWVNKIDNAGRLKLNEKLDWKVNRGIEDVSDILGIDNITDLINTQIEFLTELEGEKRPFYFRDWGAGDGTLLKDLYATNKGKDIIFYGVGDYIYFDIFPHIKDKSDDLGIPIEVSIIFFETLLNDYKKSTETTVISKLMESLSNININDVKAIHNSSIVSKTTKMFEGEGVSDVSKESLDFIKFNPSKIEELKTYIIDNFYDLFGGYFERIYISKFNDFELDDTGIAKVDFQVAIRSTSHIDSREYKKNILDYIHNSANPGSIYIDNGVHRSYTSIPRLKELQELSEEAMGFKISLIYHHKTNYFTAAVIEKAPYRTDNKNFALSLKKGYSVVDIEEAYKSTFFRLEYFIRNFIIKNFKNYDVFWYGNNEIISSLKNIVTLLSTNATFEIKNVILDLINKIALISNNESKLKYDLISMDILEGYSIDGETINDIIKAGTIYIPDWMNITANRNY